MWGIIKKAINSTLETEKFQPLDILIEKIVNDGNIPLNELIFADKVLTASDTIYYCIIDSLSVPANTTINSNKRLFIHAKGTVTFSLEDSGTLNVFKNNSSIELSNNNEIPVSLHDYFDFSVTNATAENINVVITMKAV